jgi:hypothetical protein
MIAVKQMTYGKKYTAVLNYIKLLDSFVLPLLKKHLGNEGIDSLNSIWQEKLKVIPKDISDKDKFEIAYGNWLWKWSSAFKFLKEHLGENGFEEFKRADIEALKRKDSRLKMLMLKGIRAISPAFAFSIIERQMAYELQVYSPAEVTELSSERIVFDTQHCKILDYPECIQFCVTGCQKIFPEFLAEHLKVKMAIKRHGKSCVVTIAPLG